MKVNAAFMFVAPEVDNKVANNRFKTYEKLDKSDKFTKPFWGT